MRIHQRILAAVFAMGAVSAQAQNIVECEFKGFIDKEPVHCRATVSGACASELQNPLDPKPGEPAVSESTCSGFTVRCDGETLTTGDSCSTQVTISEDGNEGTHFQQYTSLDSQGCAYPVLRYSEALPFSSKVKARLYLSRRDLIFGKCEVAVPIGTR